MVLGPAVETLSELTGVPGDDCKDEIGPPVDVVVVEELTEVADLAANPVSVSIIFPPVWKETRTNSILVDIKNGVYILQISVSE